MIRRVAVLLATAALAYAASLVTIPDGAWACSCALIAPVSLVSDADAAFVGTLIEREVRHPDAEVSSSLDPAISTFRVEQAVKGVVPRVIEVESASEGASCGLEVKRGERMGVAVERTKEGWRSSLCHQARPDVLLAAAVPGARIVAGGERRAKSGEASRARVALAAAVAVGAVFALTGTLLVRRRRSQV